MPVATDFSLVRNETVVLVVNMVPPTPCGGWPISFDVHRRFGGISGLITKSCSSGYNGVSGITVTNSGIGQFQIRVESVDTSGLDFGNYACQSTRQLSGAVSALTQGFIQLFPSIG